jgi:hypothetical protein
MQIVLGIVQSVNICLCPEPNHFPYVYALHCSQHGVHKLMGFSCVYVYSISGSINIIVKIIRVHKNGRTESQGPFSVHCEMVQYVHALLCFAKTCVSPENLCTAFMVSFTLLFFVPPLRSLSSDEFMRLLVHNALCISFRDIHNAFVDVIASKMK